MKMSKIAKGRNAIYSPNHLKANSSGYILYSRYLMEKKIGRYLKPNENVHHINNNPLDDRIENLEIMSREKHARLHMLGRRILDYGLIKTLREAGLGYKWISHLTNYPRSSIRTALKIMGA